MMSWDEANILYREPNQFKRKFTEASTFVPLIYVHAKVAIFAFNTKMVVYISGVLGSRPLIQKTQLLLYVSDCHSISLPVNNGVVIVSFGAVRKKVVLMDLATFNNPFRHRPWMATSGAAAALPPGKSGKSLKGIIAGIKYASIEFSDLNYV